MKKILPILFIFFIVVLFFWQFFLKGLLPIPSDTVVGLYHPFRDFYAKDYPRGIPFKNFLITDPVRQQYPWRALAVNLTKKGELPLWNPYSMAGYPLLGNLQSAAFYPLNIVFLLLPFSFAWGMLIFLQPLLAGIFLYLYLNNLKLNKWASLLGAITFAFCGFSIAWMEWGTIIHVGLWLSLILLSIDKIQPFGFSSTSLRPRSGRTLTAGAQGENSKLFWPIIFIFSLSASFFAGHLQTFFYIFVTSLVYLIVRWWQYGHNKKVFIAFIIYYLSFIILTAAQWIPTVQLILQSGRGIDQADWTQPGWFIPWQHLIQFVAPDFFGNPATGNYWGVWNYGEFIGYVGIIPMIFALFAMFYRWDKKTLFYGSLLFLSLIFSLPTIFAKIPYLLNIPFISTAQPTRLLFIADFSLAVLAALGFDYVMREKKKVLYPIVILLVITIGLWVVTVFNIFQINVENLSVTKRNLELPRMLVIASGLIFIVLYIFSKIKQVTQMIYIFIIVITVFDLVRFGWKFTPFTNKEYLFPSTNAISFLKKQEGQFRVMAADDRIFPPNFSVIYRLQSVSGYDPLYLSRYGELLAASERGKPNIAPPFGFNRIITPKNFESKMIDLLGVKYVLSLTDLASVKLTKVFKEGQTRVYENKNVLPRSFFVENFVSIDNKESAIESMFSSDVDLRKTAFVEKYQGVISKTPLRCTDCRAEIVDYTENRIVIEAENLDDGFLVLTDSFYPTWRAKIDGKETEIFRTDYNFRGIVVPKGKHIILFYINLL